MSRSPRFIAPEGVLLPMLARGGSALVYRSSTHPKEVLKVPIKLDTTGCSSATTNFAREDEEFSRQCHDREREIYTLLPPHEGVLASIDASAGAIRFPFLQNGDLRTYLQEHNTRISMSTREQWIRAAVESIAFIHSLNILHCDLSARNFLVADDLGLKLCDFAGSIIDGHPPLVSEEVRYRKVEGVTSSTQSAQTELFAIGSLIYEIVTGLPPFPDLSDEEIEERYGKLDFPSLENLQYAKVIEKCWTSAYDDAEAVVKDIGRSNRNRDPCMARHAWKSLGNDLTWKAVLVVPFGMYLLIFWSRRWRK
jgi:serine/threonine protein kinase